MSALAETIANQAAVLRHALEVEPAPAAERLAGAERVWLVGTGTSAHAARLGAAMPTTAGLTPAPARRRGSSPRGRAWSPPTRWS